MNIKREFPASGPVFRLDNKAGVESLYTPLGKLAASIRKVLGYVFVP